jgi:hypothetical protein
MNLCLTRSVSDSAPRQLCLFDAAPGPGGHASALVLLAPARVENREAGFRTWTPGRAAPRRRLRLAKNPNPPQNKP